jgi:hypothetical protein
MKNNNRIKISIKNTKLNFTIMMIGWFLNKVFYEMDSMLAFFFALIGSLLFFAGLTLLVIRAYQRVVNNS